MNPVFLIIGSVLGLYFLSNKPNKPNANTALLPDDNTAPDNAQGQEQAPSNTEQAKPLPNEPSNQSPQSPTSPANTAKPKANPLNFPLRKGDKKLEVQRLQRALGLKADGVFGEITAQKLGKSKVTKAEYIALIKKYSSPKKQAEPSQATSPAQAPATPKKPIDKALQADVEKVFFALYEIKNDYVKTYGQGETRPVVYSRKDIDDKTIYSILYLKPDAYLKQFKNAFDFARWSPRIKHNSIDLVAGLALISVWSLGNGKRDWIVQKLRTL